MRSVPDSTEPVPRPAESEEAVLGAWAWRGFRPAIVLLRDGFRRKGRKYRFEDVVGLSAARPGRGLSGLLRCSAGCHLIMKDGTVIALPPDLAREGDAPLPAPWLSSAQPFSDLLHALENQPPTKTFSEFLRQVRRRSDARPFEPPPPHLVPLSVFAGWALGAAAGIASARGRGLSDIGILLGSGLVWSIVFLLGGCAVGIFLRRLSWQRRVAAHLSSITPTAHGSAPR